MAFYTDALAYYPPTRRSADAYMLRIVRTQENGGHEPLKSASTGMLGGVVFARQDFTNDIVYQSVFVKACDAQALVFIFGGANLETVNEMSAATQLKLDPKISGCISDAVSPAPK